MISGSILKVDGKLLGLLGKAAVKELFRGAIKLGAIIIASPVIMVAMLIAKKSIGKLPLAR